MLELLTISTSIMAVFIATYRRNKIVKRTCVARRDSHLHLIRSTGLSAVVVALRSSFVDGPFSPSFPS